MFPFFRSRARSYLLMNFLLLLGDLLLVSWLLLLGNLLLVSWLLLIGHLLLMYWLLLERNLLLICWLLLIYLRISVLRLELVLRWSQLVDIHLTRHSYLLGNLLEIAASELELCEVNENLLEGCTSQGEVCNHSLRLQLNKSAEYIAQSSYVVA